MKWCSHCRKSVNIEYVNGTECTFWSCAECGKILGNMCMISLGEQQRFERTKRMPKKAATETTESSLTEGDGEDNIQLIGSVKKRRLKGGSRTTVRTTESSSMEGVAAD